MTRAGAALAGARKQLAGAGIETAALDARLLLEAVTGWTHADLIAKEDAELPADAAARFATLVARRAQRVPVSRLLGLREFWGLDFEVGPGTLDPRPDTETLIEAVTARVPRTMRTSILDLGTGSGCVLVALLSELPNARGMGVDVSSDALRHARRNAARLGVGARAAFRLADMASLLDVRRAGIVVSNPPYIPRGDIGGLMPEVRQHDPLRALDGGADGLSAYRVIAGLLPRIAQSGALIALEVGAGQAHAVARILASAGCETCLSGKRLFMPVKDLAGVERVVVARAPRR